MEHSIALGVTSLGDDLYVLLWREKDQVGVYSLNDYQLLHHVSVTGYKPGCNSDMTSCSTRQCLYMSDADTKFIHKYELANGATSKWTVPGVPIGMSIMSNSNPLVTCHGVNKIIELSPTSGRGVRVMILQPDIESPWHAVEMTDNQLVVCHRHFCTLHRVCLMGDDGTVTRSYGGQGDTSVGRLGRTSHLAVDKDFQFIFVADTGNDRVVMLSPTLEFVRYVNAELTRPYRLHFHQPTRRLFVGQSGGVTVIQL